MNKQISASVSEAQVVDSLAALGNQTRLRLFRLLVQAGHNGLNVGDLQRLLEQAPSTLAHHLGKLAQAGLVSQERRGREVVCTANYGLMSALMAYLSDQCCCGVEVLLDDDAA